MRKLTERRWTMAPDVHIESAPTTRHRLSGWIYAIREDDAPLIKIGCTRRGIDLRFACLARALQGPFLCVGVVYVAKTIFALERSIHALLPIEHIEGEWFYMTMNQALLETLVTQAISLDSPLSPAWYHGRYRRSPA